MRRKFNCIADEVDKNLSHPVCIACHQWQIALHLQEQGDCLLIRLRPKFLDALFCDLRDVNPFLLHLNASRFNTRDIKEIIDERSQPFGLTMCTAQTLMLFFVNCPHLSIKDERNKSDDRGKRRAQLMRDEGDKLRLHLVNFIFVRDVVKNIHGASDVVTFIRKLTRHDAEDAAVIDFGNESLVLRRFSLCCGKHVEIRREGDRCFL